MFVLEGQIKKSSGTVSIAESFPKGFFTPDFGCGRP
jgi:hypothetical protein